MLVLVGGNGEFIAIPDYVPLVVGVTVLGAAIASSLQADRRGTRRAEHASVYP